MEESEKRRERLQALRMEAASQASTPSPVSGSYTSSATPSSAHLSNPLAHTGPPPPASAEATPTLPRFDFYTDPMSAFSASKRRSGSGRGGYNPHEGFASPMGSTSPMSHPSSNRPSAGSMNYHIATPPHQFHVGHSPDQSPYEMQQHVRQSGPWRSPVPFGSPFSGPGTNPVTSPGAWDRSGGSSGHRFPPSSSRGGYMSPGFGRGGSPMNSPMNNSGRSSPHSFSGRGKTWRSGGSPSPGLTGGRGRGFHGNGHLNIKSMAKDPWRKLQPIVGSILVPRAGWLPKSLTLKKPKTEESSDKFNSQSSLAECLALSFEEAINDTNA